MCDNSSAISISKNLVFHGHIKNIKIKFHFIIEVQQSKEVLLDHYTSEDQLAEIFTKLLSKEKFEDLKQMIDVCHQNARLESDILDTLFIVFSVHKAFSTFSFYFFTSNCSRLIVIKLFLFFSVNFKPL